MKFSSKLNNFSNYVFADLNQQIKEVEKQTDKKVLNLTIGNPSFPPSSKYLKKLQELVVEPSTHLYPGYTAISEFSDALIDWYEKRFSVTLNNKEVAVLNGSKEAIGFLSLALLDENDEVLIPNPGYPAYSGACLVVGAKAVYYYLDSSNNFKIDLKEIRNKITDKTKLIWLNFPSNPTGQIINKSELTELVNLALEQKIYLGFDNAYSEITFDNYKAPSILEIPRAKEIAIELNSFSKSFSLAGYRIAWAAGNEELIKVLGVIKSQFDSGTPLFLQRLAAFCLANPDEDWQQAMLQEYQQRAKTLARYLKKIDLRFNLPKASLYIWAKIPNNFGDCEDFSRKLLQEKHIAVTPGTAFGSNGKRYVRISISSNIESIHEYFK